MRDFKYRAWNKRLKTMGTVKEISWFGNEISDVLVDLGDGMALFFDIDEVDFMECTGLKDRQGVEIYEGDIVKCDGYLWEIAWWGNEACFSFECINEAFLTTFDNYESNECEVLGNIYENPELLGEGNGD